MVTKALQGKKIKQSTPNRDLIMKCTEEIQWRDTQESYSTTWHDVKAHTEEEPPEHKKADILADKAAKLPLPPNNEHLRRLQPMWSLMYKGIPRQDDGLKTIMKTLEETGAKADAKVAPHLKPSLLSSRKHSGWSQRLSTHKHLEPRVQELFLRSKFGAIKGTPTNLRKHSEGEPFTCPLCKTSILKHRAHP